MNQKPLLVLRFLFIKTASYFQTYAMYVRTDVTHIILSRCVSPIYNTQ